jgi:Glycosyl transferase family 2
LAGWKVYAEHVPPRVTVLIATYNDEPFVAAALDSVLAQTFTDFAVLVVDDASTDRSREVAAAYAARDPRIRLVAHATNLGPAATRNRGLAAIASEYVAALDGNDVCHPERLAEHVAYLDAHPEVALVGSQATLIDVAGQPIGHVSRPTTDVGMAWCRIFQSPVIQSAATFRRAIVWDELGGYDEGFRFGEDFDLWRRMARQGHTIRNLPRVLVSYRVDPLSLTGTPRHPAREGYLMRKAPMIQENLREARLTDDGDQDVTIQSIGCWIALGDICAAQSGDDVREAVGLIERCAARFAAIHGDQPEVAALQAEMLVPALRKAPAAGRLFMLRLWMRLWRRHRPTALRAWPRFAVLFVCGGDWLLRLRLDRRRRRAERWRARRAEDAMPRGTASGEPVRERPTE